MQDKLLEVISWEYRTLRAEVEECYRHLYQTLAWGTTLLLTALGLVGRYFPGFLLWLLPVPIVFFALYYGQLVRMVRAGKFLRFLEVKVNEYLRSGSGDWQTPCDQLQRENEKYEQALGVQGFGYDFRKPLQWEQWLHATRGKGLTLGHIDWLYVFQVGIFPGVFVLILFFWAWLTSQPNYWYGLFFVVAVLIALACRRLVKIL